MRSLKKYRNSTLASSNMVSARREELERLEKERLEVNRKLERLMKKYSNLTGDRKPSVRKARIGLLPNDWKPSIRVSEAGVMTGLGGLVKVFSSKLSIWQKLLIIFGVALFVAFMIHSFLVLNGIDLVQVINDLIRGYIESLKP